MGLGYRCGGSGFLIWVNDDTAYLCQEVQDLPGMPGTDERGQMWALIREKWDWEVWKQFPGYANGLINDLVESFEQGDVKKMIRGVQPDQIRIVKYEDPIVERKGDFLTITYSKINRGL